MHRVCVQDGYRDVLPILAPNGKWSAERYLDSKSRAPCEQPQRTREVADKPSQVTMATGKSVLVHHVDEVRDSSLRSVRTLQQVSFGSEFPSLACQSNYPILPSEKISPKGILTAFTALMTCRRRRVPKMWCQR